EQLPSEALLLEALSHRVNSRDLIFELRVADDDPAVPERVVAPLELRTRRSGNRVQKLLDVALGAHELTGGERLEADPPRPGGLQPALDVEPPRRGRQGEEPLLRRFRELLTPEEDVA